MRTRLWSLAFLLAAATPAHARQRALPNAVIPLQTTVAAPVSTAFSPQAPLGAIPALTAVHAVLPASPLEVPRAYGSRLAAPKDHPDIVLYLGMMEQLAGSPDSPYDGAAIKAAQLAAAGSAGVAVTPHGKDDAISIPPGSRTWVNRWAGTLGKMGVGFAWSPLENRRQGYAAAIDANGWLWADRYGPLLTKPDSELFHEFLHAYVERGKHASAFRPLMLWFERDSDPYLKSSGYPAAAYQDQPQVRADEVLTNLNSVYKRAKAIGEDYGRTPGDWTGSSLADAPQEVRSLVESVETPLFLSESHQATAAALLPGVASLAASGLGGATVEKSYRTTMGGGALFDREIEERIRQDTGFYQAWAGTGERRLAVRFLTKGHFAQARARRRGAFPVYFRAAGNVEVRINLDLAYALKQDLDDPKVQRALIEAAAGLLANNLAEIKAANARLTPVRERLARLRARAEERVDLELVAEIRDAAREGFLIITRHFIDRKPSKP